MSLLQMLMARGSSGTFTPSFANVSLQLHFDGTNGSTTFTDSSPRAKTATVHGNSQISTAQSIFGGASGLFDGNGDWLEFADHADFEFGGGDFTMKTRYRPTAYPTDNGGQFVHALVTKDQTGGANRGWEWYVSGTGSSLTTFGLVYFDSGGTPTSVSVSHAFALNTDYALCVVRRSDTLYLFVDGVLKNAGGTAFTPSFQDTATPLKVGALFFDAGATFNYYTSGYLDELQIVKGEGRHTSTYTVEAIPFADS